MAFLERVLPSPTPFWMVPPSGALGTATRRLGLRPAPDLAVEILSPDDRPRYVLERVGEYLQADVRLLWVVDPKGRNAAVYRSLTAVRELGIEDALDGEDVVPGFRCVLGGLLG